MPLRACPDCHQQVSTKATACPSCGRKLRGLGWGYQFAIILILLMVILWVVVKILPLVLR